MASVTPLQAFELGADAIYLSKRPLPTAPDGQYDWAITADAGISPNNHSGVTNVLQEVSRPLVKLISSYLTFFQLQTLKAKTSGDRPDPRIVVSSRTLTGSHYGI